MAKEIYSSFADEFQQKSLKLLQKRVKQNLDKIKEIQDQTVALARIAVNIYNNMREQYDHVFDIRFECVIAPLLKYKYFGKNVPVTDVDVILDANDYTYEACDENGEFYFAFDDKAYDNDVQKTKNEFINEMIYEPIKFKDVDSAFKYYKYIIEIIHDMLETLDNFFFYFNSDTNEEQN